MGSVRVSFFSFGCVAVRCPARVASRGVVGFKLPIIIKIKTHNQ